MKYWITLLAGTFAVTVAANPASSDRWQASAQWHRLFKKSVRGSLSIGDRGIEFHSARFNGHWPYIEIHTFDLSPHELTLTTYENRDWREPGERRYRFTFTGSIPPEVAATLTTRVPKPVLDDVPIATAEAFEEIPAHLRARFGGSNGMLRLKDGGIDYVSENGRDSRSWRWADIQTIANPNPYELRITAYREIAEFELKRPLPRAQFERLWDRLYAADLNLSPGGGSR